MARDKLQRHVIVEGVQYAPGQDVPDEVLAKITNPKAFVEEVPFSHSAAFAPASDESEDLAGDEGDGGSGQADGEGAAAAKPTRRGRGSGQA